MLLSLHIENIAVIEKTDIAFGPGFNVLTGETGAGKSIIIDAINAVLGERTSRDVIRTGSDRASVTAQFSGLSENTVRRLDDCGFSPDEDGNIIIRRDLFSDGKNSCRVNGAPVAVSQLKAAGRSLIDIHGQHDGQKLLDDACHIDYLDRYCQNADLISDYKAQYDRLREIRDEISALLMDKKEKERKTEMLTFQIEELKNAGLKDGEEEELSARLELLRNYERLANGLSRAYGLLYGDEDVSGVIGALKEAGDELSPLSEIAERYKALSLKTEELRYQSEDAASEIRRELDGLDASPDEIQTVGERLDLIYRLKRKYGSSIAEILEYQSRCEKELQTIETAEETILRLKEQYREIKNGALSLAGKLHEKRLKGAEDLCQRIVSELRSLDMPNARFLIPVETETAEKGGLILLPNGADRVRFLISTNAGEEPKELSKIASGGELSRVMLALKNVLSGTDPVDTLIFDEVDAGISGRAAGKVAVKLKSLSKNKQVLCVTHLAQIAAFADLHFLIQKSESCNRTYTYVTELSFDGRKQELARIIGGEVITETTLKSAEELILASGA
ncbi:MAG: DNA repair protein RecN [Bacillota bacterium]|nr:DNA repair protein RecN [Bacillota bacterium]